MEKFELIKKEVSTTIPKTTSVVIPKDVEGVITETNKVKSEQNETENIKHKDTEVVNKDRKVISITHIGSDHIFAGKNNQDYKLYGPNMKFVFDGCGSGTSSEVGSRLFVNLFMQEGAELMQKNETIGEENFEALVKKVFDKMTLLSKEPMFFFNNYCFTILACFEKEDEYVVMSCGDGFIIMDDGNELSFQKLDDGEYPKYYIYNYIEDKNLLKEYKEGVGFTVNRFSKEKYQNIGVASDGLRFFYELSLEEQAKFVRCLHAGNGGQIEMIINKCNEDKNLLMSLYRYYRKFKTEEERQAFLKVVPQLKDFEKRSKTKFHDDITICF